MIEIVDGATLRVSAGYSLKVPTNVPYSMEDAHYSISLEQPLEEGASLEAVVEQARELSEHLTTGVKLMVFTELDVAFEEADGTLRPVLTVPDVPKTAPKKAYAPKPRASAAPTGVGGGKVTADFGFGVCEYYDNRPKKASGQWKPTAADFKSVEKLDANSGHFHSVWLTDKEGNLNEELAESLRSQGVSV